MFKAFVIPTKYHTHYSLLWGITLNARVNVWINTRQFSSYRKMLPIRHLLLAHKHFMFYGDCYQMLQQVHNMERSCNTVLNCVWLRWLRSDASRDSEGNRGVEPQVRIIDDWAKFDTVTPKIWSTALASIPQCYGLFYSVLPVSFCGLLSAWND